MPQTLPIRIYVKPYVRKYVLARLCQPHRLLLDEGAQTLWDTLERSLRGRTLVQVVNDYDPDTDQPKGYLTLLIVPGPRQQADISHWHHRTVTGKLTKACLNEMALRVNWYRCRLGKRTREAIELWRRSYGITEEDHPLLTAERIYHHRLNPRGRSNTRRPA